MKNFNVDTDRAWAERNQQKSRVNPLLMNIISIKGVLHVTDKETFPTKPDKRNIGCDFEKELCFGTLNCGCKEVFDEMMKEYESDVADFIRDCTPIRDEDQEYVKVMIRASHAKIWPEKYDIVDHTIYKVDIELEEVGQYKGDDGTWVSQADLKTHEFVKEKMPHWEYRRAFKVVETKEEDLIEDFFTLVDAPRSKFSMTDAQRFEELKKHFNITRKI